MNSSTERSSEGTAIIAQAPESAKQYPDHEYSTIVTTASNPFEFLLAFGRFKQVVDVNTGGVQIETIDWHRLISLSPVAAKALSIRLLDSITKYEENWGKIPTDPAIAEIQAESSKNDKSTPSK
jgi:hypothetical protein